MRIENLKDHQSQLKKELEQNIKSIKEEFEKVNSKFIKVRDTKPEDEVLKKEYIEISEKILADFKRISDIKEEKLNEYYIEKKINSASQELNVIEIANEIALGKSNSLDVKISNLVENLIKTKNNLEINKELLPKLKEKYDKMKKEIDKTEKIRESSKKANESLIIKESKKKDDSTGEFLEASKNPLSRITEEEDLGGGGKKKNSRRKKLKIKLKNTKKK